MLELWFQIYNLPLEFINVKNALVLGKKLGSPVRTDDGTFFNEFGAFMRVKVKIDAKVPFPYGVEICRKDRSPEILPIRIENLGLSALCVANWVMTTLNACWDLFLFSACLAQSPPKDNSAQRNYTCIPEYSYAKFA